MMRTGLAPAFEDEPLRESLISLGGENFAADLSGVLVHPASETLIVADLHLEKGSFFALRRQMLPPYDTAATLARLTEVVARRRPKRIISLGDCFHDKDAPGRMPADAMNTLHGLGRMAELVFITGNHDPEATFASFADCRAELAIGKVILRHEPQATRDPQIAGHLHPVARVVSSKGQLRRRCFAEGRNTLILPAFGAYTGGLNIRDRAFMAVMHGDVPRAHVLGGTRVFVVGAGQTRPD